jgi:hypothetical protein
MLPAPPSTIFTSFPFGNEVIEVNEVEADFSTHGFPVLFQNASFNLETEQRAACAPASFAINVALRALNRFWNFLARRVSDSLKVQPFG